VVKILVGPRQLFRAINWEGVFARERERAERRTRTKNNFENDYLRKPFGNDASAVSKTVLISNSRKL
jgi:hypothetical protein